MTRECLKSNESEEIILGTDVLIIGFLLHFMINKQIKFYFLELWISNKSWIKMRIQNLFFTEAGIKMSILSKCTVSIEYISERVTTCQNLAFNFGKKSIISCLVCFLGKNQYFWNLFSFVNRTLVESGISQIVRENNLQKK